MKVKIGETTVSITKAQLKFLSKLSIYVKNGESVDCSDFGTLAKVMALPVYFLHRLEAKGLLECKYLGHRSITPLGFDVLELAKIKKSKTNKSPAKS